MSDQQIIMFTALFALGYMLGLWSGYRKGKADFENNNEGWIEEAKWWRRNSVAILDSEKREHDETLEASK